MRIALLILAICSSGGVAFGENDNALKAELERAKAEEVRAKAELVRAQAETVRANAETERARAQAAQALAERNALGAFLLDKPALANAACKIAIEEAVNRALFDERTRVALAENAKTIKMLRKRDAERKLSRVQDLDKAIADEQARVQLSSYEVKLLTALGDIDDAQRASDKSKLEMKVFIVELRRIADSVAKYPSYNVEQYNKDLRSLESTAVGKQVAQTSTFFKVAPINLDLSPKTSDVVTPHQALAIIKLYRSYADLLEASSK